MEKFRMQIIRNISLCSTRRTSLIYRIGEEASYNKKYILRINKNDDNSLKV